MPHPPEGPYHWADGGETRLGNLVTLCRHHHRAVHEEGFGVRMIANGHPEFSDPHGRKIPEAPQTRYRGNVFALMNKNRSLGLEVSAETCVPNWHGESLDADMAIAKLVELENPG